MDGELTTHPSSLSESPKITSCSKRGLGEASRSKELEVKMRGAEEARGRRDAPKAKRAPQQRIQAREGGRARLTWWEETKLLLRHTRLPPLKWVVFLGA